MTSKDKNVHPDITTESRNGGKILNRRTGKIENDPDETIAVLNRRK